LAGREAGSLDPVSDHHSNLLETELSRPRPACAKMPAASPPAETAVVGECHCSMRASACRVLAISHWIIIMSDRHWTTGTAFGQGTSLDHDTAIDKDFFNRHRHLLHAPVDTLDLHAKEPRELVEYFIGDELIYNPNALITGADLYRRFRYWCLNEAIRPAPRFRFYREMQSLGWRMTSLRVGRIFHKLRLREL
jgi:hypothetical protein